MIVNLSTLVVYLPAVRDVGRSGLGALGRLGLLALVIAIIESWMLLPLVIAAASPERSAHVLAGLNAWMGRRSKAITVGVLLLFGLYFAIKGMANLAADL